MDQKRWWHEGNPSNCSSRKMCPFFLYFFLEDMLCLHIEVASWDFSVDGNTTSNHKQPFPLFLFGGFGFQYKPPLGHIWRSSLSQEIDAHDMCNLYAFQVTTFNTYGPEWNDHCYQGSTSYSTLPIELRGYWRWFVSYNKILTMKHPVPLVWYQVDYQ